MATEHPSGPDRRRALERAAPTVLAAALAAVYVIVAPASRDLAAHLFRARLFHEAGFTIWNNFWYAGHDVPGYSVLFPALAAAITPQLAGALAAAASTIPFTAIARGVAGDRRGPGAGCGSDHGILAGTLLFGAFTAIDLFTGRLPFAFGTLPAACALLALQRGRPGLGAVLAAVSALCSPVAALFAAMLAVGWALGDVVSSREARSAMAGVAVAAGGLLPVLALAVAFPEGGIEPFTAGTLIPVLAIGVGGFALAPRGMPRLRGCLAVYVAALVLVYLVPSPIGANAARLGTLLAAPVAVLGLWGRRPRLLAAAIAPLLYLGIQGPVSDVVSASGQPSVRAGFYRPLLAWLESRPGPPFRIEIPFTDEHWEAYWVATRIPIARGWERQLDERDNPIFYRRGALDASSYRAWLRTEAIRYVAVPDAPLDYSARAEVALIRRGLAYLRLVHESADWRVYAVRGATPLASAPAELSALGPDSFTLRVRAPATTVVRIRFSPYWTIVAGAGCVAPDGPWLRVHVSAADAGEVRLTTRFALGRIGARSPRCTRGSG